MLNFLIHNLTFWPIKYKFIYNLLPLSSELGNLTQLKDLNVINNKLEWLPWQLCNCASLNSLSFDGNAVHKIPRQLMRHQGLTDLYASGNKLSSLPQGNTIKGLLRIKDYLIHTLKPGWSYTSFFNYVVWENRHHSLLLTLRDICASVKEIPTMQNFILNWVVIWDSRSKFVWFYVLPGWLW